MDPLFQWVLASVLILFGGSLLGLFRHYLLNKKKVDNAISNAADLVNNYVNMTVFNADRQAALTNLNRHDALLKDLTVIEGEMSTKKVYPNLYRDDDSKKAYSPDFMVQNMLEVFDELIPVRSELTEGDNGNVTYKCMRGEEFCYVKINYSIRSFYRDDEKTQPILKATNFVPDHFVSEAGEINYMSWVQDSRPVEIIVPITQTNFKIDLCIECLVRSEMEYIFYPPERKERLAYFQKMVIDPQNNGFKFVMVKLPTAEIEQANLYYSDVDFEHDGKRIQLPAEGVVAVSALALLNSRNVTLFGECAGVGKTRLATEICRVVSQAPDVAVILLDPAVVASLNDARTRGLFEMALQDVQAKNRVFFIDEAEVLLAKTGTLHTADNTFALSFLDGMNSAIYKTSIIMTFNAPPSSLNSKMFRAGRIAYMFNMKPISKAKAIELVAYLKTRSDYENLVFQQEKFNQLVEQPSTLHGENTPYALPGFTTVADVMSCFVPKSEDDFVTIEIAKLVADPSHASKLMQFVKEEIKKRAAKSESNVIELEPVEGIWQVSE